MTCDIQEVRVGDLVVPAVFKLCEAIIYIVL